MENPGPGYKQVMNETQSITSRTAKSGKRFTYELKVIQQPFRARACGAGAKASADRRPVDPPPIVELKIFEGPEGSKQDVTFSISANYFLFATLELARKHAQPRGIAAERQNTVLTGTPVAGMVCLERPERAGYFIFPDLSVRHEGLYRLSFSLFEDLRDGLDDDGPEEIDSKMAMGGINDKGHATNRLEVKSVPFTVYSAKKFPGLTESTSLSRVVAEQGCRVRIRRDVRMRKRESKGGKDWEGYEDATAEERARMSATPEASNYAIPTPHGYEPVPRPRSGSNASYHSIAPSAHPSRRTSMQEMNQAYHSTGYGTSPQTPHTNYHQTSPYSQQQAQSYAQAPFMQHQSAMQPPQPQYAQPAYAPRPAPVVAPPVPAQQNMYNYGTAPTPPPAMPQHSMPHNQWPQPQHQQPQTYEPQEQQHHRSSVDYSMSYSQDHHRSSSQYSAPPSAMSVDYGTPRNMQEPYHGHSNSQSYQQAPQPPQTYAHHHSSSGSMDNNYSHTQRPAPLEPIQPPTRANGTTTPIPPTGRPLFDGNQLPPIHTNNIARTAGPKILEPSSPMGVPPPFQTGSHSGTSLQESGVKRYYGQVFSNRHQQEPLRQGQRPSTPSAHQFTTTPSAHQFAIGPNDVDDAAENGVEGAPTFQPSLQYRRANGMRVNRGVEQQQGPYNPDATGM